MLFDSRQKVRTPAERLRGLLDQLEVQLGKMDYSTSDELLQIPVLFDEIQALHDTLRQDGVQVAGEWVRFDDLGEQFRRKTEKFLKGIGGAGALVKVRAVYAPTDAQWWWFMDMRLAEQNRMQLRQRLKWLGITAGVFVVLGIVYMLFLRPDQATRMRFHHQQTAEQLVQQGDYAAALVEVESALLYTPDVAELHVWRGVLLEVLEQSSESERAFVQARVLAVDERAFLGLRAQTYLYVNLPERSLVDALGILQESPDAAEGYFLQAQAYYLLLEYALAYESYEKAAVLAADSGQTDLEASARVQLAYLTQEMMGGGGE